MRPAEGLELHPHHEQGCRSRKNIRLHTVVVAEFFLVSFAVGCGAGQAVVLLLDLPQFASVVSVRAHCEIALHRGVKLLLLRRLRKERAWGRGCEPRGEVEVSDHEAEIFVDQEILGLDVAVDDAHARV